MPRGRHASLHGAGLLVSRYVTSIAEFTAQYARRAGAEGIHAQGIRRCGLRRACYLGLAKTHLQHLLTAVALNVIRLGEWWLGTPPAKTRCSPFAAPRGPWPKLASQMHAPP